MTLENSPDKSVPDTRPRTDQSKLHIRILAPKKDGTMECIERTPATRGGNHIRQLFKAIDDLLDRGFKASDLVGATVETYADNVLETTFKISTADLGLVVDRRYRTNIETIIEEDDP